MVSGTLQAGFELNDLIINWLFMFLFNLLNLVVKPRTLTKSNLITVQAKSPVGSEDNEEKFTQKNKQSGKDWKSNPHGGRQNTTTPTWLPFGMKPRTFTKSNLITVPAKSPVGREDNQEKFKAKKEQSGKDWKSNPHGGRQDTTTPTWLPETYNN